jgi:hypothetical protein
MKSLRELREEAREGRYLEQLDNAIENNGGWRLKEEYNKLKEEEKKYDFHISAPIAKGEMTTIPTIEELKNIVKELDKALNS